jgi:uncharacterized protein
MISRVTDDYERMARGGCVAVSEPAFWAGFDRGSAEGFRDYFRHLTDVEPKRAANYGIQHYSWMCINAKEAENIPLGREVIAILPEFLDRPTVLGVGEIGLNKNTRNESVIFREQVELAVKRDELILIHTPHLEDKYMGTMMILDMLAEHGCDPSRVLVDHVEEHTIRPVLDAGYWCGMTLYPISKCITVNSAGDWGPSNPLAVQDFIFEMRARGHAESKIRKVVYDNPLSFFAQCRRFQFTPREAEAAMNA